MAAQILQFLFAILVVDFASGVVHWLEDTYWSPETPILGPLVIGPNIEHHRHPMAFTIGPAWRRNAETAFLASLFALAWWRLGWLTPAWGAAIAVGGIGNEIHCWAHLPPARLPRVVRWLQQLRILQTRQHHVVGHHQSPFDQRYCAILNVLNPLLDRLRFWRGLERAVFLVFRVAPRNSGEQSEQS